MNSRISSNLRALRLITFLGLAALPGLALLPGCGGGGNGGGPNVRQTSRLAGNFDFGNGQVGAVDLSLRSNGTVRGNLTVTNAVVNTGLKAAQAGSTIDLGKYGITGTYNTSTGRFTCTGSINGEPFSLDVTPPSGSTPGSATMLFNGVTYGPITLTQTGGPTATATATGTPTATVTGTPTATVTGTPTATVTGTPTATATRTPTATPTTTPANQVPTGTTTTGTINVTLSNAAVTGGNFAITNKASVSIQPNNVGNTTTFGLVGAAVKGTTLVQSPGFTLNKPSPLLVGDEYQLNASGTNGFVTLSVTRNLTNTILFSSTAGTVKITSVQGKKVNFSFNVTLAQLDNESVTATMSGTGSATLN